jgi:hypothetical protein
VCLFRDLEDDHMILAIALLAAGQAATCPKIDAALPSPLASWNSATQSTVVTVGKPTRLALKRGVALKVTTSNRIDPAALGATVSVTIQRPGAYEVALSEAAWIDLVSGGSVISSTSHRHGPPCTSIRKVVGYVLKAGTYSLQISGSKNPEATVAIYAMPK